MKKILVIGAAGQIGSELVVRLRKKYGNEKIIAGIHKTLPSNEVKNSGPVQVVDATKCQNLEEVIEKYHVDTIFHLASVLSALGEKNPDLAWNINIGSLKNILDVAKKYDLKIFWPSSIAAFGPSTPKDNTPQTTIMDPCTMYGVTKVAGELLCNYYFEKFAVDVRSLRYPGLISYKTPPGGGTTDYAVSIFYKAIKNQKYTCFLKENTILPMMYMPDAIRATIDTMEAKPEKIKIRTSYNLAAMSFSPKNIVLEIKKHIPEFQCEYKPDFRQKIADSWVKTIDDSSACTDWGWKSQFDLEMMVRDMLKNLKARLKH